MNIEAEKRQHEPNQLANQDKSKRLNTNREKERHKAINSQHMYTIREEISREKQRMENMYLIKKTVQPSQQSKIFVSGPNLTKLDMV